MRRWAVHFLSYQRGLSIQHRSVKCICIPSARDHRYLLKIVTGLTVLVTLSDCLFTKTWFHCWFGNRWDSLGFFSSRCVSSRLQINLLVDSFSSQILRIYRFFWFHLLWPLICIKIWFISNCGPLLPVVSILVQSHFAYNQTKTIKWPPAVQQDYFLFCKKTKFLMLVHIR